MNYESKRMKKQRIAGASTEELFLYVINVLGKLNKNFKNIRRATVNENKYQHIDFFINGIGYDVKHRDFCDQVWLEAKGNYGHDGWLLGKAKYIVMFYKEINEFIFYKRENLMKFARQFKQKSDLKVYYRWYTRKKWNRKDLCLLVKKSDIQHLEAYKIKVEEYKKTEN